jgi:hypothetical protein
MLNVVQESLRLLGLDIPQDDSHYVYSVYAVFDRSQINVSGDENFGRLYMMRFGQGKTLCVCSQTFLTK